VLTGHYKVLTPETVASRTSDPNPSDEAPNQLSHVKTSMKRCMQLGMGVRYAAAGGENGNAGMTFREVALRWVISRTSLRRALSSS